MGFFELPNSVAAAPLLAPAAPVVDATSFYIFCFAYYYDTTEKCKDTKDVKGTVMTCHQGFAWTLLIDWDNFDCKFCPDWLYVTH